MCKFPAHCSHVFSYSLLTFTSGCETAEGRVGDNNQQKCQASGRHVVEGHTEEVDFYRKGKKRPGALWEMFQYSEQGWWFLQMDNIGEKVIWICCTPFIKQVLIKIRCCLMICFLFIVHRISIQSQFCRSLLSSTSSRIHVLYLHYPPSSRVRVKEASPWTGLLRHVSRLSNTTTGESASNCEAWTMQLVSKSTWLLCLIKQYYFS